MCVEDLVVPVSVGEGQALLALVKRAVTERIDALWSGAISGYQAARDLNSEEVIGEFRLEALGLIESPLARLYVTLRDVVPELEDEDPGRDPGVDEASGD